MYVAILSPFQNLKFNMTWLIQRLYILLKKETNALYWEKKQIYEGFEILIIVLCVLVIVYKQFSIFKDISKDIDIVYLLLKGMNKIIVKAQKIKIKINLSIGGPPFTIWTSNSSTIGSPSCSSEMRK